jgi:serine/threonine-protein kinase
MAYIAMELLSGHDLTRHTRPGQLLTYVQVLSIGHRVALALAHAHSQGVVHRDIKPANVMIDLSHGAVKVMDFGIARLSDAARTRTGLVLGSPLYMSPEQLTGKQVDGRSDIYSLGLLLYQLLSGRLPFEATNMADLLRAVAERPVPSLRAHRPDLPAAMADVIELAMQKRPALRYATASDLATDLALLAEQCSSNDDAGDTTPVHEVSDSAQGTRMKAGNGNGFVHNRTA